MSGVLEKLAPTAIILAMVAWCCWSYLGSPGLRLASGKKTDLPCIEKSLLALEIKTSLGRDPFQAVDTAEEDSDDPPTLGGSTLPKKASHQKEQTTAVVPSLVLDATYVRGNRRMALINGRVYAPGDHLTESNSAAPFVVKDVFPDRVVIEHKNRIGELTYTNSDPTSDELRWTQSVQPPSESTSAGDKVLPAILNVLRGYSINEKP